MTEGIIFSRKEVEIIIHCQTALDGIVYNPGRENHYPIGAESPFENVEESKMSDKPDEKSTPQAEKQIHVALLPTQPRPPSEQEFPHLIFRGQQTIPYPPPASSNRYVGFLPENGVQYIFYPVPQGYKYRVQIVVARLPGDDNDYAGKNIILRDLNDFRNQDKRWLDSEGYAVASITLEPSERNGASTLSLALGSLFIPGGSGHQSPGAPDIWEPSPDVNFYSFYVYQITDDIPPPPPVPEPGDPITNYTPTYTVQGDRITSLSVPNFPADRVRNYMILVWKRYGSGADSEIVRQAWTAIPSDQYTLPALPPTNAGNRLLDTNFELYAVDDKGAHSKPVTGVVSAPTSSH